MHHNAQHSGSAYGPRPSLVLDEQSESDLLDSLGRLSSDSAKASALRRWKVYSEDYADLIKEFIDDTHHDDEIKRRIHSHIKVANNLALDITNAVSSVWKHASASHMSVEGASEAQNAALRALVEESGFHRHARSWNREAFLCGPVTAIPVVRRQRLFFDTLLPHFYSSIDDADDPWGPPLAAAWDVDERTRALPGHHRVTYASNTSAILLDANAWYYYERARTSGASSMAPRLGVSMELIGRVEHNVGEFPGATLDFDISHGGSRWSTDRHQRLIDATITVGAIEAILGFVRKSQHKKLLTILGNLDGISSGQTLDPEKPLVGRTQSPNQLQISAIDFDLDPENHIKHEAWIMQTIARSYGGQVASRPGSSSILEAEVAFSHEALTEQRNEQIPFAKDFTRDLLAKAVRTCIEAKHPLYLDLPDPELIRSGLLVKYPPLSRSFANVDEQIKWHDHALHRGLMTFEDLLRPSLPGASEEELRRQLTDNLTSQADMIRIMTTRDQSLAPTRETPGSETESQANGRQGPKTRDSKEEENNE